ncbi:Uncharacterised protein [Enterobacter cloacae]|nr:Uncharacterised protein [Enterobacter cloacae]
MRMNIQKRSLQIRAQKLYEGMEVIIKGMD